MSECDILVVEDELDLRELLAEALGAENFSVKMAQDGIAAMEILNQGAKPFLAICDISMPRMDGLEFLANALKVNRLLSVILLTGNDESENIREALQLGAFDYLLKPLSHSALIDRAYRALSIARIKRSQDAASPELSKAFRTETLLRLKNSKSKVA